MTMKHESNLVHKISDYLANGLLNHRLVILAIGILLTIFLAYQGLNQQLSPGFDKAIPLSHPYMKTFTDHRDEFGGANRVTIFVENRDGDMFSPEFFTILEKITSEVLVMDGVDARTVTSLFTPNVNYVAVSEEGFTGSKIVPADFIATPERIDEVKSNLFKSTEIGKTVAKDLSGALVIADLVEIDPISKQKIDYELFAEELNQIRSNYQTTETAIHIIGFAPFIGDVIDGAEGVINFFIITLVITFIMLIFFAGSIKLAIAVIITALVSVSWQLGIVKILGYGVDPMSILVPFLILAIGVSHAIQMTNVWRLGVAKGDSSIESARQAFYKLFIPGATALISDAVGFGVIVLIDIPIIRELGIIASIGVAVMLLTNKIMLPILLSYIKLNDKEIQRAESNIKGTDHAFWMALSLLTKRKYATIVLVLAMGLGAYAMTVQDQLIVGDVEAGAPEFWPDSRYNKDADAIQSKFSVGLDELVILAKADKKGSCINFPITQTVDDFVWQMQNIQGVQSVKSLSQLIRERNIGNYEANPKFLGVPRSEAMIAANIYRVEMSQALFSNDCTIMPVTIYLTDHKAETLERVMAGVARFNENNTNEHVTFVPAMGNAGIMAATNEIVAKAQTKIELILFAAVGLFCFVTFMSIRATICIVVPLALVAYLANAVMVYLGIGLKVSTLPVLAMGVGVGVDYGIYLFARMVAHNSAGEPLQKSYYESLKEVGTGVVFTSVTMTIGVLTWYFSDLKFQADMGILLAYMFFVNMLGATILIPALASFLYPHDGNKEKLKPE
ncbi:efflux RND transporter permease subunit [Cycloclasticus pugetii]|uniref:efflux RND transporter permease subunit n=1 Tax=Cycloclasticus pugetii TaxID=34068 RepID=UPI00240A0F52|nr:MMPL family transporter [Cycloclasticus pugetii]MDF1830656.1 MMPL family transporter [Cycloclasticus pugetii]